MMQRMNDGDVYIPADEADEEFTAAVGMLRAGDGLSVGRCAADGVQIAVVPRQNQHLDVVRREAVRSRVFADHMADDGPRRRAGVQVGAHRQTVQTHAGSPRSHDVVHVHETGRHVRSRPVHIQQFESTHLFIINKFIKNVFKF